jgi:CheY-like chemotaxis protein
LGYARVVEEPEELRADLEQGLSRIQRGAKMTDACALGRSLAQEQDMRTALARRFDNHLTKPDDPAQLEKLADALKKGQLSDCTRFDR